MGNTEAPLQLDWPPEILTRVLQLVPQQQRLTSCTLVSHAWHAAAVAASSSISIQLPTTASIGPGVLDRWLQMHSTKLQSITVNWGGNSMPHIPAPYPSHVVALPLKQLPGLQELSATSVRIESCLAYSSTSLGGTIGGLTALTALRLLRCDIPFGTLGRISDLVNLRNLQLMLLEVLPMKHYWHELATSLPQLRQLTHLALHVCEFGMKVHGEGVVQLPLLTNLQKLSELVLEGGMNHHEVVAELPRSLTHLKLGWLGGAKFLKPAWGPFQLTTLCHLELEGATLAPHALSDLVQLQFLMFKSCSWTDSSVQSGQYVSELLRVLQYLSRLQHLQLSSSLQALAEPVQAYTSLVSSSHLTHLDLKYNQLPRDIAEYLFRPDRQLPALRVFEVGSADYIYSDSTTPLHQGSLERIVHFCPNLQELFFAWATWGNVQLTALQQLSNLNRLTKLSLGGPVPDDEGVSGALLQLRGLKELHLLQSCYLGPEGVVSLIQLTKLSMLELDMCGHDERNNKDLSFDCKLVSTATPPDVHLQLMKYCCSKKACIGPLSARYHMTLANMRADLPEGFLGQMTGRDAELE